MNNTRIAAPVLVRSGHDKTVRLFFDKDCNCRVNAGGQFELEIDGGTIKDLNQKFVSAMALAASLSKSTVVLNKVISDDVMSFLREAGLASYNSLGDAFHQELARYRLDSCHVNMIIQSPASFPLLWEFIYTGSPHAKLDADLFWGSRHRLTRILTGIQDSFRCAEDARRFVFCQNKKLSYSNTERDLLQKLSHSNDVDFFLLDNVFRQFSDESSEIPDKIIRTWAAGGFDFIHIASHLESPADEKEGILNSKIKLTLSDDDVNMSLMYLISRYKEEGFKFTRSPLVFLNACKTMTNPAHLSHGQSFPRTFMKFGAGAVIATACDVPDLFANEFAEKYYDFLFQSKSGWWDSLGEALRKTREYFLQECNNPLGLAYGLYTQYES